MDETVYVCPNDDEEILGEPWFAPDEVAWVGVGVARAWHSEQCWEKFSERAASQG